MIRCNSPFACYGRCIIDMDAQQSRGGAICCDWAEDMDYDAETILKHCPYAERVECLPDAHARNKQKRRSKK